MGHSLIVQALAAWGDARERAHIIDCERAARSSMKHDVDDWRRECTATVHRPTAGRAGSKVKSRICV